MYKMENTDNPDSWLIVEEFAGIVKSDYLSLEEELEKLSPLLVANGIAACIDVINSLCGYLTEIDDFDAKEADYDD